jgi:PIN domain nuclease of toxin-antitoxin system
VWWTGGIELLSSAARDAIEAAESVLVSTISCREIGLLAKRGRMRLDRDVESWVAQALEAVTAIPPTAEIALAAALLAGDGFPRDPADRIIYATARDAR